MDVSVSPTKITEHIMSLIRNAFEYLELTAGRVPNKVAFADEKQSFSFAELEKNAVSVGTCIACRIGVESGVRKSAAVLVDRTAISLIGMLGALAAGFTYVPLDVKMPDERLTVIWETVRPAVILFAEKDRRYAEKWSDIAPIISLEEAMQTSPEYASLAKIRETVLDIDPVYTIFTSGSTGMPKGIVISHRALIDFTEWMTDECGVTECDVLGNQAPFYFDLSVKDIYQTLRSGCTTYILPKKFFMFPTLLVDFLNEKAITTLIWATSAFRMTADSGILAKKAPKTVCKIILGGEALQAKHLNVWKNALPTVEVINLYGPTEVTVDCTMYKIDKNFADNEPVPIGRACRNMEILLLDENLKPVRNGEPGEICVRGIGLALGYYGDPEKTAAAFVQNPLNPNYPDKLYRTGDIAKLGDDGELYFLSRRDDQIKHMGYRIELGEIETALGSLPEIRSAICFFDEAEDKIVCCAATDAELSVIINELKTRLPVYMLPNKWKIFDRLPNNANGKIDRAVLKEQYFNETN